MPRYQPVQIAYFVNDIRTSAERMVAAFGAGPFFLVREIELAWGEHRGTRCDFLHSSAYGQWGNVMLELVQQDREGPSPFRDLYAPGQEGLHHVACFVADVEGAIRDYAAHGLPLAARAMTRTGTEFAFIDATASLGHMIEIYVAADNLRAFYDRVADAARGWNGEDPIRELG